MFENSYSSLPEILFKAASLAPVAAPKLVVANDAYAVTMGLDKNWLHSSEALQVLSGNVSLQNTSPIAMAYAGHQFGHWVPSLGDGRAILSGEIVGPDGIRRDLHLKGAGRTPYSRNGDGRATLGAMLREYIVSEAMAALGIPTTRSLAVVATGESIMREGLFPGAVLTRVARSHVRVGTFQYLSAREEDDALHALTDYEIARNFPGIPNDDTRYIWFLREIIARQASLIAKWMNVGFIHGVMNTDNMQVCGETIDYGPCAFMDTFNPQKVFSSIDEYGRYAWDKQPVIALWNLTRLAEALLPLLNDNRERAIELAQDELKNFMPAFEEAFETGVLKKLGILNRRERDAQFIAQTLQHMIDTDADFTLFFSGLSEQSTAPLNEWQTAWRKRLTEDGTDEATQRQTMRANNPLYIPRNHRIEQAIAAANRGDFEPFNHLVKVLRTPFDSQPENTAYAEAPIAIEVVHETFCGT